MTLDEPRRFLKIRQPRVGARPDECDVDFRPGDTGPGPEPHERERLVARIAGNRLGDRDRLSRVDAPGDRRLDGRRVERHAIVVACVGIGYQLPPPRHGAIERVARGRKRPSFQERVRRLVGIDVADAGAAFNRHVADGHPLVERHPIDRRAAVLVRKADAALDAEAADDRENHVLGIDAALERAAHVDAPHLQRIERQALRRQHVAHLRGADAEGNGPEGSVCGGVAVAARDGHSRLSQTELGADHVHDALVVAARRPQRNAELATVPLERHGHVFGHDVEKRPPHCRGRHDVIDRREGAIRPCDAPAVLPQHVERLRRRHFVNKM